MSLTWKLTTFCFLRIAGVDTSSTVLSYMCYTLANRSEIVAHLRCDIDPLMPEDDSADTLSRRIPDITVLNKLPYLTAFVKECKPPRSHLISMITLNPLLLTPNT